MSILIYSLFESHPCLEAVAHQLNAEIGSLIHHQFPDGESYIKFEDNIANKDIIILNSLDSPNNKILPLLLTAETAKDLGARSVGLCAPYLSYMRQDKRFKSGEGVTSKYFAKLLSESFHWLVTVDPHLHRYHDLAEIYSMPTKALHANDLISNWIVQNIKKPILIGPDSESEQWVAEIARINNLPYIILEKIRSGDYNVDVSKPNVEAYLNYTPVLIDDIISTGRTMLETINHLKELSMQAPVCIGVHALFADNAYDLLQQSGVAQIVTCNSIEHTSNYLDLSEMLSQEIRRQIEL